MAVSRGSHDRGVMAAASVPQGVRSSNHRHGRLVVHCKEQIVVRVDAMWKGLCEFTHENARLEALHV